MNQEQFNTTVCCVKSTFRYQKPHSIFFFDRMKETKLKYTETKLYLSTPDFMKQKKNCSLLCEINYENENCWRFFLCRIKSY